MTIDFDFTEATANVIELITEGLTEISFESNNIDTHSPLRVRLHCLCGSFVTIESVMHDLDGEYSEAGILHFKSPDFGEMFEHRLTLGAQFNGPLTAAKMIVEDEGYKLSSGLVLSSADGDEIFVMASEMPEHLALQAPGLLGNALFRPEYALNRYRRVAIG